MNESEESNDDKPVEKAQLVYKWHWDNSLASEREMMNDSITTSLLASTKVSSHGRTSPGGRLSAETWGVLWQRTEGKEGSQSETMKCTFGWAEDNRKTEMEDQEGLTANSCDLPKHKKWMLCIWCRAETKL